MGGRVWVCVCASNTHNTTRTLFSFFHCDDLSKDDFWSQFSENEEWIVRKSFIKVSMFIHANIVCVNERAQANWNFKAQKKTNQIFSVICTMYDLRFAHNTQSSFFARTTDSSNRNRLNIIFRLSLLFAP